MASTAVIVQDQISGHKHGGCSCTMAHSVIPYCSSDFRTPCLSGWRRTHSTAGQRAAATGPPPAGLFRSLSLPLPGAQTRMGTVTATLQSSLLRQEGFSRRSPLPKQATPDTSHPQKVKILKPPMAKSGIGLSPRPRLFEKWSALNATLPSLSSLHSIFCLTHLALTLRPFPELLARGERRLPVCAYSPEVAVNQPGSLPATTNGRHKTPARAQY